MGPRTDADRAEAYARCERGDGKTHGLQHILEQVVLLEAIPSAMMPNESLLQRSGVERDGALQQDVNVFDRDGTNMRLVQRPQGRKIRPQFTGISDAAAVRSEVDGFG